MEAARHRLNLTNTQSFINDLKGVTIITCNVRSLSQKKLGDLKLSLDCDFLCVCESWVEPENDGSQLYWSGKTFLRNDRSIRTGGGLLTYISQDFSAYCTTYHCLEVMEPYIEIQAIEVDKPTYKRIM